MGWLNYDQSLARARQLKARIEAHGVPVSIELQRGSGNSRHWGHDWFAAEMSHHVASRRSQGLTPFLSLIKKGRAGSPFLPPPLSNGYMGFDGIYRIISMGLANHPGSGGPFVAGFARIPKDQGRYYIWGTEFEGGMDPSDWTPHLRAAMGGANAGVIDWLREDMPIGRAVTVTDRNHMEHSSWTFRKVDRTGYTRETGIAEIGAARAANIKPKTTTTPKPEPKEEDPMAAMTPDQIGAAVAGALVPALRDMSVGNAPDAPGQFSQAIYRTQSELMRVADQLENLAELAYAAHTGDDDAAEGAINAVRARGVDRHWEDA